jgi:predicted anti-sigma-YlaC factor YlaD
MTCADYQRRINRFIDREVKAAACGELFEHLGQCEQCRAFYDSLLTVGAELDRIQPLLRENAETPVHPMFASTRQPIYFAAGQRRIAPRPSSLLFAIVVMLVVTLLFSVDVSIEKPTQVMQSAATSQR